eukprot:31122-Pelagococcus_subviridis.AAC.13
MRRAKSLRIGVHHANAVEPHRERRHAVRALVVRDGPRPVFGLPRDQGLAQDFHRIRDRRVEERDRRHRVPRLGPVELVGGGFIRRGGFGLGGRGRGRARDGDRARPPGTREGDSGNPDDDGIIIAAGAGEARSHHLSRRGRVRAARGSRERRRRDERGRHDVVRVSKGLGSSIRPFARAGDVTRREARCRPRVSLELLSEVARICKIRSRAGFLFSRVSERLMSEVRAGSTRRAHLASAR